MSRRIVYIVMPFDILAVIEEKEINAIIRRALNHYLKKIENLRNEEHLDNNDILQKDLTIILRDAKEAVIKLSDEGDNYLAPYVKDSKVLRDALSTYIRDLKDSKQALKEKLGEGVEGRITDREIEYAKRVLDNATSG